MTKATHSDIPSLATLINSCYRGDGSKQGWTSEAHLLEGKRIDDQTLERMMQDKNAVFFKEIDKNQVTACVYLKKNENKMYLGMLSVSPELQAKGTGKMMMEEAEKYSLANGCDTMQIRVISVRDELVAWYERRGYQKTGESVPYNPEPGLSKALQPLEFIIMEKKLNA